MLSAGRIIGLQVVNNRGQRGIDDRPLRSELFRGFAAPLLREVQIPPGSVEFTTLGSFRSPPTGRNCYLRQELLDWQVSEQFVSLQHRRGILEPALLERSLGLFQLETPSCEHEQAHAVKDQQENEAAALSSISPHRRDACQPQSKNSGNVLA